MGTVLWSPDFEAILRKYLPLLRADEPVEPDTSLTSYGLDSLATISLLADLEMVYELTIPDDLLATTDLTVPTGIWTALEQARAEEAAA